MQLKKYQQKTLKELSAYIAEIKKHDVDDAARLAFYMRTNEPYKIVPEIGNVPFVCIKVPTAGGKTLIAAFSVGLIFEEFLSARNDKGLVMWFVPSDAIKKQTLKNLRNRNHPYREVLDKRFDGAVKIFDLKEAKAIKKDDLENNLCIVISTLSAFRRADKDWLKAYQDNGALMPYFEGLKSDDFDFLEKDKEGEIKYSLANIIKLYNPLVVVDEGHNVQTKLSFDMLKGLNPSFILEFTATPKGFSNILIKISAKELKKEKMIKMPIYLANKTPWQDTIYAGIEKLEELKKAADKNKEDYIRPIMIIQAEQEKENQAKIFVGKIYNFLVNEVKILENEIAIQTAKRKDLPEGEILLSKNCQIKYIITVNALREGWDCPFAYVLVSVSNLGARLSVEQTIGRIMRLPYAKEHNFEKLNSAYIFASTESFTQTSDIVIKALQENGYEGIIPIKNSVSVSTNDFKIKIDDKNIILPYINIKDGKDFRKLDYVGDLIGGAKLLEKQSSDIEFKLRDDSSVVKLDINKEGQFVKDAPSRLSFIYHYKDFTKEDLLFWFFRKVQRGFIAMQEMNPFLEKIIDKLLNSHSLSLLSANCYKIKEEIESQLDQIINSATTKRFDILEKEKNIIAQGKNFIFDDPIALLNVCSENFSKHLYERAGGMNDEEKALAYRLDNLDNIVWWFRNPENTGFFIQGWLKNKFYPDFIVKTKKKNYFILEYKGAHLKNLDTDYKEGIGKKWQELSNGNYYFELVGKENIDLVIERIKKS